MFGCAGPLLCGLCLVMASRVYAGCGAWASHWWLLLLLDTGSGAHGLSSCSFEDLEYRLSGCGVWA